MKCLPLILIVILFYFTSCGNTSEQNLTKDTIDNNKILQYIKETVHEIDENENNFKKIQKNVFDFSTEGSEITGYYDEKKIKKIIVENYGETGKSKEEYYYDNNEIILYILNEYYYDSPIYETQNPVITNNVTRTAYFYNGKLFREENLEFTEEEILKFSYKIQEILRSK